MIIIPDLTEGIPQGRMVTAAELENQIFDFEQIRVVLRCRRNKMVFGYQDFDRQIRQDISLKGWIDNRLIPLIGSDIEFEIIDPRVFIPNINIITIGELRKTYVG